MPIVYNVEAKQWEITNITPEEAASLLEIGKKGIVAAAGKLQAETTFTNILKKVKREQCFES